MNKQKLLSISTIFIVVLSLLGLSFSLAMNNSVALAPTLGEAASYSVLGATAVTNSGDTNMNGAVGVSPGLSIDGGITAGGGIHPNDASAIAAKGDALTAFGFLESQGAGDTLGADLTGQILVPGIYTIPGVSLLSGTLTLDGDGVYIFLTSGLQVSGNVIFINGARACDLYWHDTSSVNITGSFAGTVIALTSITFGDSATLDGRALALNGNVTLLTNTFTGPLCTATESTSTPENDATSTTVPENTDTPVEDITPTSLPGIVNLPKTGGGPIQDGVSSSFWFLVGLVGIVLVTVGIRSKLHNK